MAKLTNQERQNLILDALKVDEFGKPKYTQRQLAQMYGISVGMVNRYVRQKRRLAAQIIHDEALLTNSLLHLQNQKSKQFSAEEVNIINERIGDEVKNRYCIERMTEKNLLGLMKILEGGFDTVLEHLIMQEVIDKAAVTLGVTGRK